MCGCLQRKIQYDRILAKLKLRIFVRGYLQNKDLIGDNWSPTASMRTLKYFLEYNIKNKAIVHQLYFIGAFLESEVNNRVFVKLDSRYSDYFPVYSRYFGRSLRLMKSMFGIINSGNLFSDELTEWLIESGYV